MKIILISFLKINQNDRHNTTRGKRVECEQELNPAHSGFIPRNIRNIYFQYKLLNNNL